MEKLIRAANKCCDEALITFFRATYFLGEKTIIFDKYLAICELLITSKASYTKSMYYDEKYYAELLFYISNVKKKF